MAGFPIAPADEDSTRLILHNEIGDAFGLEICHHAAQLDGGLLR